MVFLRFAIVMLRSMGMVVNGLQACLDRQYEESAEAQASTMDREHPHQIARKPEGGVGFNQGRSRDSQNCNARRPRRAAPCRSARVS